MQNQYGAWGPFEWTILRDWFVSEWLHPETQVYECSGKAWQPANEVPILWKVTESLRKKKEGFEVRSLMSEKLPVSPAQAARLVSLGWPGSPSLLRNYYWANKLRERLETIFPDSNRPAFDDPAWPWSGGCPAQQERWQREIDAGPPEPEDEAVLRFFYGSPHGFTTLAVAKVEVVRLFSDSDNRARWWKHNESVPASDRQVAKLEWAAKRLGRKLPKPLNNTVAHKLIEEWFDEFSELEDDWREERVRRQEKEMDDYVKDMQRTLH